MLKNPLLLKFIKKSIEVEVDSAFAAELVNHRSSFSSCGNQTVTFSLFELINSIGIIKSRINNPTQRSKFDVNSELVDWLENCLEFRIKIEIEDPEVKKSISEDFGIGLAAVVTNKLFKIRTGTLAKIRGSGKRPDFRCQTNLGKFVVVESKGTVNSGTRTGQMKEAIVQKTTENANIHVASGLLLKTSSTSNVKYKDPPVIPPNDPEYLRRLLMAHHYSQAFNYIGQKYLSKYFSLMVKRIMHNKEFEEYNTKDEQFREIKKDYLRVNLRGYHFFGRLDLVNHGKYVFSGFDQKLLSLAGFLNFEEYEKDLTFKIKDNLFSATKDGICLGFINDISSLPAIFRRAINRQIELGRVKHYQDYTTITDIDIMDTKAFSNFFYYIFKKLEFKTSQKQYSVQELKYGFHITYKDKHIIVQFKKSTKTLSLKNIETLMKRNRNRNLKQLFVTNRKVSSKASNFLKHQHITIIDRSLLKKIITKGSHLIEILEKM